MNKKFYLGAMVAASLFAVSCSNDDDKFVIDPQNAAQVTFNVELQGGIATRSMSDGGNIDKLIYAVYNTDGELLDVDGTTNGEFINGSAFATGLSEKISLTLPKEQQFTIVFWAQDGGCEAYNTSNLRNVTVDYSKLANNNDGNDAFYAVKDITVTGNDPIPVVLERPFAQVNVGVTDADWNEAQKWGVTIAKSQVVMKQVASSIDLMTGEVDNYLDEVTCSMAAIPGEKLTVEGVEYTYLSMSYILAAEQKETLESLEFTFSPVNGADITFSDGLTNVPVQRNYRTNIVGKMLTGEVDFIIEIDADFAGENTVDPNRIYVEAENTEELAEAIDNAKPATVVFLDDITYSGRIVKEVALDLNENTINTNGCITLNNNASLSLKNGSYTTNVSSGYLDVRPTSEEGCVIIAEDVDFINTYLKYQRESNSPSATTNRLGYILQTYPLVAGDIDMKMHFKNCTFTNAALKFGGSSGQNTKMDVTFENCTFTALTGSSSGLIEMAANVNGTLTLDGCTFNLTCTSSSACGVYATGWPSTTVKIYAKNNTVNAVAAEKYTYDPSKGENANYNIYVPYAVNSVKFFNIGTNGYTSLELDENNTMTGIAKLK